MKNSIEGLIRRFEIRMKNQQTEDTSLETRQSEKKKKEKKKHSQGNRDTIKHTKVYMMGVSEGEKRGKRTEKSKKWWLEISHVKKKFHQCIQEAKLHSKQDKRKDIHNQAHDIQNVERQRQILKASEKIPHRV